MDECILQEFLEGRDCMEAIEHVSHEQGLVYRVVHDGRGEVVETKHIRHLVSNQTLYRAHHKWGSQ